MMDTRRVTAYHEAGHCLASHVHNIPIRSVSIEKADGDLGSVYWVYPQAQYDPADCLMVALAGEAAERNLLGIKRPTGVGGDFAKAAEAYAAVQERARFTKRRVPTVKEIIARVDALVLKHAQPITNLAAVLMACGSLHGLTAHQILQNAISPHRLSLKRAARAPLAERLALTASDLFAGC